MLVLGTRQSASRSRAGASGVRQLAVAAAGRVGVQPDSQAVTTTPQPSRPPMSSTGPEACRASMSFTSLAALASSLRPGGAGPRSRARSLACKASRQARPGPALRASLPASIPATWRPQRESWCRRARVTPSAANLRVTPSWVGVGVANLRPPVASGWHCASGSARQPQRRRGGGGCWQAGRPNSRPAQEPPGPGPWPRRLSAPDVGHDGAWRSYLPCHGRA
jgi:hypothetical protein